MPDPYPFLFGAVLLFMAIDNIPRVVTYMRKNFEIVEVENDKTDGYIETERKKS